MLLFGLISIVGVIAQHPRVVLAVLYIHTPLMPQWPKFMLWHGRCWKFPAFKPSTEGASRPIQRQALPSLSVGPPSLSTSSAIRTVSSDSSSTVPKYASQRLSRQRGREFVFVLCSVAGSTATYLHSVGFLLCPTLFLPLPTLASCSSWCFKFPCFYLTY